MTTSKRSLIIFFITAEKTINGGILSIFSLCKTSRSLVSNDTEVLICTYPGTKTYKKNDLFENDERIYSFDEILQTRKPLQLQLHVPEYASTMIFYELRKHDTYLKKIPDISVNILNQNLLQMRPGLEIAAWHTLASRVTQTTAHDRYSTQDIADEYCLPTLHMSTFVDPTQYYWTNYSNKEDLILLSNDSSPYKEEIIEQLQQGLPEFSIVTIENMAYTDYKKYASRAKFLVTFGEGFDGYYVEGFFSGGMTLAVYNDTFFPDSSFEDHSNIYPNYITMLNNIVDDIKRFDNEGTYKEIVQLNFKKIAKLYSFDKYVRNLKRFYAGKFEYIPTQTALTKLIGNLYKRTMELDAKNAATVDHFQKIIEDYAHSLQEKESQLLISEGEKLELLGSLSWGITKPLRVLHSIIGRSNHKQ